MTLESPDDQTEWFHRLAALPEEELRALAPTSERENLIGFIRAQLPGTSLPELVEPQAFAEAVTTLRANERKWNQALQRALIEADDLAKERRRAEAKELLVNFASGCPWALFKEVAENQASWYQ
jgi:hypothetical protein